MTGLTVVSYNIHRGRGLDRRLDLGRIVRVLRETDADVVGLQEVFAVQAQGVAQELGMEVVMAPTRSVADGRFGNAVLSRLSVKDHLPFDLTRPGRQPRGGLRVDLEERGVLLHLFNVHFGLSFRERREQVEVLRREALRGPGISGLRILVGDFNEWLPGPVGRHLCREFGLERRPARRTHPAPLPLFSLDGIYWDAGLRGLSLGVHRSPLARVASDHLPLVARLTLPA